MRHGVKKTKFNFGYDANRMLMRKLAVSFLAQGYLKTTITKAKKLKSFLERLVTKMKARTESNKNILLHYLGNNKVVEDGFNRIGPAVSKISGGFVRVIKLRMRSSDGSLMARVEWAYPLINEEKKTEIKNVSPAPVKVKADKEK